VAVLVATGWRSAMWDRKQADRVITARAFVHADVALVIT